jgi:hypothetical protein
MSFLNVVSFSIFLCYFSLISIALGTGKEAIKKIIRILHYQYSNAFAGWVFFIVIIWDEFI